MQNYSVNLCRTYSVVKISLINFRLCFSTFIGSKLQTPSFVTALSKLQFNQETKRTYRVCWRKRKRRRPAELSLLSFPKIWLAAIKGAVSCSWSWWFSGSCCYANTFQTCGGFIFSRLQLNSITFGHLKLRQFFFLMIDIRKRLINFISETLKFWLRRMQVNSYTRPLRSTHEKYIFNAHSNSDSCNAIAIRIRIKNEC